MKSQIKIFGFVYTILITLFTANTFANSLHNETATFKVYGNCEMCKKRIESSLKGNSAIISAAWDVKSKVIKVVYDPHSISIDKIHQLIAEAGHDTEKVRASDGTYKKLPGCCQYDRKKISE
ncbi:MAG: heavy-metal-associated domain-containing protein [Sporocytophaga sp.]|uniref:heavy-metal-associated domain-containing protein n=1 Tax=Sporocytophaga sp. TaxID=2231183 RepID=UPI001B1E11F1|nr:heavy-metal-associated domain-containing protein [Sporocytophaga sp.]MBO9701762.1 heavy-metal-associated domain-containing protein [Sporocytophaga sp.]